MKVCLVRPPFRTKDLAPYPPFSLLTLAPYLEEPFICDMQSGDNIHDYLFGSNKDIDVFAFSAFTSQLRIVNNLIRYIKKNCERPHWFMVGGAGVTSNPEYARRMVPEADTLVSGDGETFDWKKTYSIVHTEKFNWIDHKTPAWNLTHYKRYRKTCGFAVETSRGCPFNCVWCTAHLIHGKQWRPRTPESAVLEMRYLKWKYRCKRFYFTDDNASANPERWINLMKLIISSKLDVTLTVPEGIQAHHLNLETLQLMKQAGFRHITIGAESGSNRVLNEVIDKGGLTTEKIEEAVRDSISIGLNINCFFVIGTPGETLQEAEETVRFAEKLRQLGAYSCSVRNAIPIPGTRMFQIAKVKGYLTVSETQLQDMDFVHCNHHLLRTPDWNPEQIMSLVAKAKQQDAAHILKQKRLHLLAVGVPRLISNPKLAVTRFRQLWSELKEQA